jgi:virginiamycin B lyase
LIGKHSQKTHKIGRASPSAAGTATEFSVPTASGNPYGLVTGPDDNLWFTEYTGNKIGRITTLGTITEFSIPTANSATYGIVAGPDGNLWFVETGTGKIGRITP